MKQVFSSQRGVSLYIAFMVMSALLALALGISSILLAQIGILRGIGHSVFSFYATDAGVEHALYLDNTACVEAENHAECLQTEFNGLSQQDRTLSNGAFYALTAENPGEGGCPGDDPPGYNFCVRSLGAYKEAQRAVRVAR